MIGKEVDAIVAQPVQAIPPRPSHVESILPDSAAALPPRVPVERRHKRPNGSRWLKERLRFLYQHPLCAGCEKKGRVTAAQEVDHIIPLERGGKNQWSNYQALCRECHEEKTAEENGGTSQPVSLACNEEGWPTDPDHPWNRSHEPLPK